MTISDYDHDMRGCKIEPLAMTIVRLNAHLGTTTILLSEEQYNLLKDKLPGLLQPCGDDAMSGIGTIFQIKPVS